MPPRGRAQIGDRLPVRTVLRMLPFLPPSSLPLRINPALWEAILQLNPTSMHRTMWARVLGIERAETEQDTIDSLIERCRASCAGGPIRRIGLRPIRPAAGVSINPTSTEAREITGHLMRLIAELGEMRRRLFALPFTLPIARVIVYVFNTFRIPLWGEPIDGLPSPEEVQAFVVEGSPLVSDEEIQDLLQNALDERGVGRLE